MKYIAIALSILAAFWCGVAFELARRPAPIVYLTKAEPVTSFLTDCTEVARACRSRERLAKVGL